MTFTQIETIMKNMETKTIYIRYPLSSMTEINTLYGSRVTFREFEAIDRVIANVTLYIETEKFERQYVLRTALYESCPAPMLDHALVEQTIQQYIAYRKHQRAALRPLEI